MVQENELVVLGIGIAAFAFAFKNRRLVYTAVPHGRSFLWAVFFTLILGWMFTVTEGFFLTNVQNLLEHVCYLVSSSALLVWCLSLKNARNDTGA